MWWLKCLTIRQNCAMGRRNKCRCYCSCGCEKKPRFRRVECSNCGHHVCPGYCLALDEIAVDTNGVLYKYSLCRQCLKLGTRVCDDGVDRILCDGKPWPPHCGISLQEMIIAYVLHSLMEATVLQYEKQSDEWEIIETTEVQCKSQSDEWDIV